MRGYVEHCIEAMRDWKKDMSRMWPGATKTRITWYWLSDPATRAIFYLRLQLLLHKVGLRPLSRLVSAMNQKKHGIDIVPGASIGPGLILRHPNGIVIGAHTRIGHSATIMQGATFGQRRVSETGANNPQVENNVTIGAHAILLGGITIGEGAAVGAGSLVMTDVPAHGTVGGNPARPLK